MKRFCFILLLTSQISQAQIAVSDNHRFLKDTAGKPFFWLGDTDWELFHRMTREETDEFLEIRKSQGFNVIQAVALAEFAGLREPNRYGDWPLNNEDPTQLATTPGKNPESAYEYDYWDHVDYVIDLIASKGMYVGLLPTWGDKVAHMWGDGPIVFNDKNAEVYGRTLATRYKDRKNIIWILGGDRPVVYTVNGKDYNDKPIWDAMAKGIEDVVGSDAFITYHHSGGEGSTSSTYLHQEKWLDMNSFQSSHGSKVPPVWDWVKSDLAKQPQKPTLDMEPCYEDHPVNPWDGKWTRKERGYFSPLDVRARIYRSVFAGGCGITYGHHQIWQFMNEKLYKPVTNGDTIIGWRKAARAEVAGEMQYLKALMLSRPYFSRIPDQSLIKSDPGKTYVDVILSTRDESGSYAMAYLPQNKPVKINLGAISGATKTVWWFDPRSGKALKSGTVKGKGVSTFTPPKDGADWILVIDDASKGFGEPGKM